MDKQEWMVLIGENTKACRKGAGMTQAQLAEAANIGVPFIANIESWKKMASVKTLLALSDALKVSSDALLRKDVRLQVLDGAGAGEEDAHHGAVGGGDRHGNGLRLPAGVHDSGSGFFDVQVVQQDGINGLLEVGGLGRVVVDAPSGR